MDRIPATPILDLAASARVYHQTAARLGAAGMTAAQARVLGQAAYCEGLTTDCNPYEKGTVAAKQWGYGWKATARMVASRAASKARKASRVQELVDAIARR